MVDLRFWTQLRNRWACFSANSPPWSWSAAQARLVGAKMSYWPDLSAYVSSGPLFSSSNGQSYWFSTDQLTLSAGIRVPVDLNGQIRNSVVEARQALETLQAEVTAKQRLLIRDCRDKQRELSVIEHELTTLERRMRALEQLMGSAPPTALASLLHTWARLQTNASELRLKASGRDPRFSSLWMIRFWNTMGRDIARPSGVPKSLPGSPIAEHPN